MHASTGSSRLEKGCEEVGAFVRTWKAAAHMFKSATFNPQSPICTPESHRPAPGAAKPGIQAPGHHCHHPPSMHMHAEDFLVHPTKPRRAWFSSLRSTEVERGE